MYFLNGTDTKPGVVAAEKEQVSSRPPVKGSLTGVGAVELAYPRGPKLAQVSSQPPVNSFGLDYTGLVSLKTCAFFGPRGFDPRWKRVLAKVEGGYLKTGPSTLAFLAH